MAAASCRTLRSRLTAGGKGVQSALGTSRRGVAGILSSRPVSISILISSHLYWLPGLGTAPKLRVATEEFSRRWRFQRRRRRGRRWASWNLREGLGSCTLHAGLSPTPSSRPSSPSFLPLGRRLCLAQGGGENRELAQSGGEGSRKS